MKKEICIALVILILILLVIMDINVLHIVGSLIFVAIFICGGDKIITGGSKSINYPRSLPPSDKDVWNRNDLQVNTILQDMYKNREVLDADNKSIKYNSGISPKEGWYLYKIVQDNNVKNILEIGMAFGTSALYMCQALKDSSIDSNIGRMISVDPFQSTQWSSVGMLNLERAGLNDYHELMEMGSEIAMPQLLSESKVFDLVFVDGMHLFDYTLLDIFYATKLLKINGILIVDDMRHRGVNKTIRYIKKNYKFLKYIDNNSSSDTMATFVKIADDDREWDFHADF